MTINPYQPTAAESQSFVAETSDPSQLLWGTWSVFWRTVVAVAFAGAAFGGVCGFIPIAMSPSTAGAGEFIVGTLFLIPIAGIFGVIFASIAAVPTVGLLILVLHFSTPNRIWSGIGIRRFAFSGGFLSGFLAISVPSGFDQGAVAFSLVPAIFGGVASLLAMMYLSRNMPK